MQKPNINEIIDTQDGSHSLLSKTYGVSYHSKYGAIQESMHVFINAGLKVQLHQSDTPLRILEYGFGTGLNAYLSYLVAEKHQKEIYYEGIEAFPIDPETALQLNYPSQLKTSESAYRTLHKSNWNEAFSVGKYFLATKWQQQFENFPVKLDFFDVIFFDAFAPTAQPELWEEPVLKQAFDCLKSGGVFVTYCAKGVFKRTLKSVGFQIEALPGPPGKREMTRGKKP